MASAFTQRENKSRVAPAAASNGLDFVFFVEKGPGGPIGCQLMAMQLLKVRSPQGFETEFKVLSDDIVRLFAGCGLSVRGYHDPALVHYSALSDDRKTAALERLRIYHQSLCRWSMRAMRLIIARNRFGTH